jgi:hypothetical protein
MIHLNNVQLGSFQPTRGDPLSPYLFLFVADGLSRMLQHEISTRSLHELMICQSASGISHLLFADDTLMFMEVIADQACVVEDVLCRYKRCTGQLINPVKCSIMFGSGCLQGDQERVKQILRVEHTAMESMYLGLLTPEGHMSKDKFKTIKERIVNKFNNWAERNMSS